MREREGRNKRGSERRGDDVVDVDDDDEDSDDGGSTNYTANGDIAFINSFAAATRRAGGRNFVRRSSGTTRATRTGVARSSDKRRAVIDAPHELKTHRCRIIREGLFDTLPEVLTFFYADNFAPSPASLFSLRISRLTFRRVVKLWLAIGSEITDLRDPFAFAQNKSRKIVIRRKRTISRIDLSRRSEGETLRSSREKKSSMVDDTREPIRGARTSTGFCAT